MTAQCWLRILDGLIDGLAHLMRFELKMELVGVQLGDLSGLADQAIEPVAFFIDYLEQIRHHSDAVRRSHAGRSQRWRRETSKAAENPHLWSDAATTLLRRNDRQPALVHL